ncbi:MAG TPA: hypothetical protein VF078_04260 [Nitrospira sp.]
MRSLRIDDEPNNNEPDQRCLFVGVNCDTAIKTSEPAFTRQELLAAFRRRRNEEMLRLMDRWYAQVLFGAEAGI